jgi:hypothetical protein
MARDVMILMWANPLQGPLEGVGPENGNFLGLEMGQAKRVPFGPKKVSIFMAHPFEWPE